MYAFVLDGTLNIGKWFRAHLSCLSCPCTDVHNGNLCHPCHLVCRESQQGQRQAVVPVQVLLLWNDGRDSDDLHPLHL